MSDTHTKTVDGRTDLVIDSLRNLEGLEIEVLETRFKRVESDGVVAWYTWGQLKEQWFFTTQTWAFETIFQLGKDNA